MLTIIVDTLLFVVYIVAGLFVVSLCYGERFVIARWLRSL